MKILGERFGKKYGKGKKSDMDFVKMDVSKVRRFQEELMVDVRNMKLMIENITETIETLKTKENTTPGHLFKVSENNQGNEKSSSTNNENNIDNDNVDGNHNNNNKTDSSSTKPNTFTIPYSMSNDKKSERVQKKSKRSEEDFESETSSTSSQDSSDNKNRESKRNKKRNKRKNKSGHKERQETDSDSRKHEQAIFHPSYPPLQDFRQNVYSLTPR